MKTASQSGRAINLASDAICDTYFQRMRKIILGYIVTVLIFGAGIYATLLAGKKLEHAKAADPVVAKAGTSSIDPIQTIRENIKDPFSRLLIQVILIVLFARLFGILLGKLGQPAVIGEMIAGIVLGPSVVGALFPHFFDFVFPANSLGILRMLSQVGVILFMFVVGMDLDLKHLRDKADVAVMVSHVSIIFPYFLGVVFAYFIYNSFASANASFLAFALFMGIAMSITAFPVLARILEERRMTYTFLGATALTCAAVGDVTAWVILAVVVALVKAGAISGSLVTILLVTAFIAFMLFGVKPLVNRLSQRRPDLLSAPTKGNTIIILVAVFTAALFTELIGIHAIFGAFLVGIAMPADESFRKKIAERLENFSSAFLLPLFFAFTGLRTQIGLLNGWEGWTLCGIIILIATVGKLGGSMSAALWTGMNWRDSFALGALMNTRGLVELIVLNIGLDLGILTPQVFAMMIVMALFTTCMTGPLLSLVHRVPKTAMAQMPSPVGH